MEAIAGILLLATLVEGTITYLFGAPSEGQPTRWYLKYVSLAFGIAAAFAYKVDLLGMVGLVAISPYVSYVASGLIIGRGSNYVNDIIGKFRRT